MIEKRSAYFLGFVLVVISISLVSAGISDFFRVTGQASSQAANVTVYFKDTTPAEIRYVSPVGNVDLVEAGVTYVNFSVQVYDFDKLRDINFSSVYANISNGSTTRGPVQCLNTNNLTTRIANFSCSVDLWYWDTAGPWRIGVVASDIGNRTLGYNISTFFTVNQLKAMVIAPQDLTWPVLETFAVNQTSDNDPTVVNNTGNYNGTVELTGYDLLGESDPNEIFIVSNFTTGLATGTTECNTTANVLINDTAVTIVSAMPNPGNLSINDGSGQENLYYCIPSVPNVTSQTYSTLNSSAWVIAYGI